MTNSNGKTRVNSRRSKLVEQPAWLMMAFMDEILFLLWLECIPTRAVGSFSILLRKISKVGEILRKQNAKGFCPWNNWTGCELLVHTVEAGSSRITGLNMKQSFSYAGPKKGATYKTKNPRSSAKKQFPAINCMSTACAVLQALQFVSIEWARTPAYSLQSPGFSVPPFAGLFLALYNSDSGGGASKTP